MCKMVTIAGLLVAIFGTRAQAQCPPGNSLADLSPPTDVSRTFIRQGAGEYGASRAHGSHTGVDLLTRASYDDKLAYAVHAMADGKVAYSQFNGVGLDNGFGNVVVVDHGNNCYVMFAHLAGDPFTPLTDPDGALMVKLGQAVKRGQVIGYFVDMTKGVYSTGNAMRTDAGARWQTHIEMIEAPSDRAGKGNIADVILKKDGKRVDPTPTLKDLGYQIAPNG
jgi:murein DD-endopeptidase MepM/ murein hydrolase activator NlpD